MTLFAYELFELLTNQGRLEQQRLVAWQKTGTKGEFSLAVKAGTYRLEAKSSGNRFLNQSIANLVVTSNTTCNISLSTGYLLTGQVFTNNGTEISEGTVVAQEVGSSSYFSIASIESGKFSLVLPRGEYYLAYRPLHLEDLTQTQTSSQKDLTDFITPAYLASELAVVEVMQDRDVEITLPAMVTFRGKIFDHRNATVSGVIVTAQPSERLGSTLFTELGLAAKCQSDSEGNFQLFLQPGAYDFKLNPDQSSSLFSLNEGSVSVYDNCDRKFHLREGCSIDGQILHQGEIIPDCSIAVFDSGDQFNFNLKTDRQGQFKTTLPKGRYKILVSAHEQINQSFEENYKPILAPAISEIDIAGKTEITLELEEGRAIFGKVVDESRRPRVGVSVSAYLYKPNVEIQEKSARKPGVVLNSGITDSDGYYYLHLAPGNYLMVANNDFSNAKFVELSFDALELEFTLAGWRQLFLK